VNVPLAILPNCWVSYFGWSHCSLPTFLRSAKSKEAWRDHWTTLPTWSVLLLMWDFLRSKENSCLNLRVEATKTKAFTCSNNMLLRCFVLGRLYKLRKLQRRDIIIVSNSQRSYFWLSDLLSPSVWIWPVICFFRRGNFPIPSWVL
jgi:hypothetical protein